MSYILLTQPLTREECKAGMNQYVEGVISIDLQVAIDNDFEGFLDMLEYKLIGDQGIVTDIEYDVVGVGIDGFLHIRVTGYADLCNTE